MYDTLLIAALMTYPFIRLIETRDAFYVRMLIGMVCAKLFVIGFRMLPLDGGVFMRPPEACNCDAVETTGECRDKGKKGMPSGHVTVASLIIFMLMLKTPTPLVVMFGTLCITGIGISRIMRKCHTPLQVIIGAVSGLCIAIVATFFRIGKS